MSNLTPPSKNEVDAVYLWVDSSRADFIEQKNFYAKKSQLNKYWSPTRDHNEILHSIQSVRKNMDWIRTIYVLVPKGHKINNLDTKKYGVKYVTHDVILGEENCPNFNSSALELFQHNIPGLSNYFLAFNDDFFISKPASLNQFFDFKNNKINYYYEKRLQLGMPFSHVTSNILQDWFPEEKYYFWMCHMPRMFLKQDIQEIIEMYPELSKDTKRSKFRNKKDIQLVYLYGYYLLYRDQGKFIFLENILSDNLSSLFNTLIEKIKLEGLVETLKQVYLQYVRAPKLARNKQESNAEIYALINIENDHQSNKKKINQCLQSDVKFICLNDSYTAQRPSVRNTIYTQNYQYFYKNLLDK